MALLVLRKMAQYGILLMVVLVIVFALPRLAPGGPLRPDAAAGSGATPQQYAELASAYGFDRPIVDQFMTYVGDLAVGTFGRSFRTGQDPVHMLAARIPWTLLLVGTSVLISILLGVPLGVYTAVHRGSAGDVGTTGVALALRSMPAFWIGMVLISIFATQLRLLPTFGATSPVPKSGLVASALDIGLHLVLPLTVLTLATLPSILLTTRSAMVGALEERYVDTAYAKGLSLRAIRYRHALRSVLPPIVTVIALNLGFVVGGAVVVETVFAYPGVGRLMYEAVLGRDYPVLQIGFLFIAVSVIVANFFADLSYPILDPRARVERA